jgi:hypothetical protein
MMELNILPTARCPDQTKQGENHGAIMVSTKNTENGRKITNFVFRGTVMPLNILLCPGSNNAYEFNPKNDCSNSWCILDSRLKLEF